MDDFKDKMFFKPDSLSHSPQQKRSRPRLCCQTSVRSGRYSGESMLSLLSIETDIPRSKVKRQIEGSAKEKTSSKFCNRIMCRDINHDCVQCRLFLYGYLIPWCLLVMIGLHASFFV